MGDYLLKIKSYVDEPTSVGVILQQKEYVDEILKGLPSNYPPAVLVI